MINRENKGLPARHGTGTSFGTRAGSVLSFVSRMKSAAKPANNFHRFIQS
jgi:hypothetical protein